MALVCSVTHGFASNELFDFTGMWCTVDNMTKKYNKFHNASLVAICEEIGIKVSASICPLRWDSRIERVTNTNLTIHSVWCAKLPFNF